MTQGLRSLSSLYRVRSFSLSRVYRCRVGGFETACWSGNRSPLASGVQVVQIAETRRRRSRVGICGRSNRYQWLRSFHRKTDFDRLAAVAAGRGALCHTMSKIFFNILCATVFREQSRCVIEALERDPPMRGRRPHIGVYDPARQNVGLFTYVAVCGILIPIGRASHGSFG